jgi:hypothetical protein
VDNIAHSLPNAGLSLAHWLGQRQDVHELPTGGVIWIEKYPAVVSATTGYFQLEVGTATRLLQFI